MTWKTFTIKEVGFTGSSYIRFDLNGVIYFRDVDSNLLYCGNCSPFNTWCRGEKIEVNVGRLRYETGYNNVISDISKVRNSSLRRDTSLIPWTASNSLVSIANQEYQSGRNNFECKIEDRNGGYEKIIYNQGNWRYEKTSFGN